MTKQIQDLEGIIAFRKKLHQFPSLSNDESKTALLIKKFLEKTSPTTIIENVGGIGIIAVHDSGTPGPTVVFRCELDALPIQEINEFEYKSLNDNVSHKCGHDGHMAILCALSACLKQNPPKKGKVALLFQPAEEIGEGAKRVVEDPAFESLHPDFVFAIHNYPGVALGQVMIKPETTTCGSFGLLAKLKGASSHAAYPHEAHSPKEALCELLLALPQIAEELKNSPINLVSITHASLGVPSYGIVPGEATIQAVFRSDSQKNLETLRELSHACVQSIAKKHALQYALSEHDYFPAGTSDHESCELFEKAAHLAGLKTTFLNESIRWSEDFAYYTQKYKGALVAVGSGESCAPLHSPQYDFPDELIGKVVPLFDSLVDALNR